MSVRIGDDFFTDSGIKRYSRFYQQLIGNVTSFQELGSRLVKIAEHARAFRQDNVMREAAQALTNIPLKDFQIIGSYYIGLFLHRSGTDAQKIFEQVVEHAPAKYRCWAMQSLAATYNRRQDYASELYWRMESLKFSPSIEALRSMAVVKALEGYHKQALKELESLLPLSKYAEPVFYYTYLNSLAVELTEAGRTQEARNICKVVLASPFAFAYPEWQETAKDLKMSNRSFVATGQSPSIAPNVLFMPAPEHQTGENPAELKRASRPARVFNMQQWKPKMVIESNSDDADDHSKAKLSDREMLLKIVELASTDDLSDEALYEMVEALEKIVEAHKQKQP